MERLADYPTTRHSYGLDSRLPMDVIDQIDRDLPRTAGIDPLVQSQLHRIRAVLLRYAAEDPKLGYCQGMNYVAAVFTAASGSQAEAYSRFKGFVQRLRNLWTPGFPLLETGTPHFQSLVKERPWFKHICSLDVHTSMYLPHAWLTSFVKWVHFGTLVACLDLLELHGFAAVLALTVAVLDNAEEQLLKQNCMDDALRVLCNLKSTVPSSMVLRANIEAQIPQALAILLNPQEHGTIDQISRKTSEDWQSYAENALAEWASQSSNMLRWSEAEALTAGSALLRWAQRDQGISSSRTLFNSGTSVRLIRFS